MLRVKLAAALTAASIGVISLSACSAQPGTAVSVNGVKYSEDEVTQGVFDYKELTGKTFDRSTVVRMIPDALKFTELAQQIGLQASNEDVDAYLDTLIADGKVAKPSGDIGPVMTEVLRYTVISSAINTLDHDQLALVTDTFNKIVASQQVKVNPRYGTASSDGTIALPKFADVVDASDLLNTGENSRSRAN